MMNFFQRLLHSNLGFMKEKYMQLCQKHSIIYIVCLHVKDFMFCLLLSGCLKISLLYVSILDTVNGALKQSQKDKNERKKKNHKSSQGR